MAKTGTKKGNKPQAPVHLPAVSQTQQKALVRDVNKLLAARGIVGKITELRLADAGAVGAAGCPPGQTRQVVCRKQPDGRVVCQEECV